MEESMAASFGWLALSGVCAAGFFLLMARYFSAIAGVVVQRRRGYGCGRGHQNRARGHGAASGLEPPLPYPDLAAGNGASEETRVGRSGGGCGGGHSIIQDLSETGAGDPPERADGNYIRFSHRRPVLTRIVGVSDEQLIFRLSYVTRD